MAETKLEEPKSFEEKKNEEDTVKANDSQVGELSEVMDSKNREQEKKITALEESLANMNFDFTKAPAVEREPIISVELNKTFNHTIENYTFGNLSNEICKEIWKDGRPFSHFIESWLAENYPLVHIKGCKKYDFTDKNFPEILYDEKTFTKKGCRFCPSNMIGQGRKFDKEIFEEKTKKLVFCIVSNIDFPNIKVRFVRGTELLVKYKTGIIPSNDFIKFFD